MRSFVFSLLICLTLVFVIKVVSADTIEKLYVLVDSSSSMNIMEGGKKRIDYVKEFLNELCKEDIKTTLSIDLLLFSYNPYGEDPFKTKLIYSGPWGDSFCKAIDLVESTTANTAIFYALESILDKVRDQVFSMVVITDGEENSNFYTDYKGLGKKVENAKACVYFVLFGSDDRRINYVSKFMKHVNCGGYYDYSDLITVKSCFMCRLLESRK